MFARQAVLFGEGSESPFLEQGHLDYYFTQSDSSVLQERQSGNALQAILI